MMYSPALAFPVFGRCFLHLCFPPFPLPPFCTKIKLKPNFIDMRMN